MTSKNTLKYGLITQRGGSGMKAIWVWVFSFIIHEVSDFGEIIQSPHLCYWGQRYLSAAAWGLNEVICIKQWAGCAGYSEHWNVLVPLTHSSPIYWGSLWATSHSRGWFLLRLVVESLMKQKNDKNLGNQKIPQKSSNWSVSLMGRERGWLLAGQIRNL